MEFGLQIVPSSIPPPAEPPKRASPLFRATAVAAFAFVVTILALIATVFGNSRSPVAGWLNRNAGVLLAAEVAAILSFGFAAMAQDRKQALRDRNTAEQSKNSES